MAIGIQIGLDAADALRDAAQVDKALDSIAAHADKAQQAADSIDFSSAVKAAVDNLKKADDAAVDFTDAIDKISNAFDKLQATGKSDLGITQGLVDSFKQLEGVDPKKVDQLSWALELLNDKAEKVGSGNALQRVKDEALLVAVATAEAAAATEKASSTTSKYTTLTVEAAEALRKEVEAQEEAAKAKVKNDAANAALIRSMSQQVQIARASGLAAEKLKTSFKLNADATDTQRYAAEKLTEQLYRLNQAQKDTEKSGDSAANSLQTLVTAGKAFLGLAVVQQVLSWGKAFVSAADEMTALQGRLKLYTSSQEEANAVFGQLTEVANKAGASIQDVTESFSRFANAGKDIGATNGQIVNLIKNLQNMGSVSGSSARETASAVYELSHSFASGTLQGNAFRSLANQMPIALDELAKKLGVTREELKKMSSEGKLTSDKLLLLASDMQDLDTKAASLPRTIEQAATALTNNLGVAADALNKKLGLSGGIAERLDGMAQALDVVTKKSTNTWTEADELNKTLGIQQMLLKVSRDAFDDLGNKTDLYAQYMLKQIAAQQADVDKTKEQIAAKQRLAQLVANLAGDVAVPPTQAPRVDPNVQKQVDTLKQNVEYTAALTSKNYELAASIKLGSAANKEQIATYAKLLQQQTESRESRKAETKASNAAASEAARLAKEQEKLAAQNEKYIRTLTVKVAAGDLDVQRYKEQVAQAMVTGQSVDQLSASYYKSIQAQQALELQSRQTEAQSRLNASATQAQKDAVDAYVASLYRQEQVKQQAAQMQQINKEVNAELNPVQAQFDASTDLEAQRLTAAKEWRDQFQADDLAAEQQYQDMKTKIQQAGEQQRNDIMTANNAMLVGATGDAFAAIAGVLKQSQGEQSGIYKAMFAVSKAFATAQAGILMWENVSKAMAIGFPQNIPFIAAAIGQGTTILGNLSSIGAVGFADGGPVSGFGSGTSDSINAKLSNGEYVMPSRQTRQYRNELAQMRNGTFDGNSGGSQLTVEVANYGNDNVTTQQLDENRVRIIIGEEVPRINAEQFTDPYSQTNKAFQGSYTAERRF